MKEVVIVTGASSGIGAATAQELARAGFDVVLGARRLDRLQTVAAGIGPAATPLPLDVTDAASVRAFADRVPRCEVLVCNAGGALGLEPVPELSADEWRWMWEANVLGLAETVRAFLPKLIDSGDGRIAIVTSIAGHQVYAGGAGYAGAKHAAAAVTETLRLELLGQPVRITEIVPGLVRTEFSSVRFRGDEQRAEAVYAGLEPLTAEHVADAIVWAVTRPLPMTVARIDLYPRAQASGRDFHRT